MIKLVRHFKFFITLSLIVFSSITLSVELTDDIIKKAKSIAVFKGTFDPITFGHFSAAQEIVDQGLADIVIIIPTKKPPHKEVMKVKHRLEMIELMAKDNKAIVYTSPRQVDLLTSDRKLMKHIREINPNIKVKAVVGTDLVDSAFNYNIINTQLNPDEFLISNRYGDDTIKVHNAFKAKKVSFFNVSVENVSSSKARAFLMENRSLYFFKNKIPLESLPNKILHPDVSRYIFKQGLYINTIGSSAKSPITLISSRLKKYAYATGMMDFLKKYLVNRVKNDSRTEIKVNGEMVKLKKHLGSGLSGDAYIINVRGKDFVIKIANDRKGAPLAILKSAPIQNWINARTKINAPKLIDYDPSGKWMISELVAGEPLEKYLKKSGGVIDKQTEAALKELYSETYKMYESNRVKLDLAADNIHIFENKAILVDTGPIPYYGKLPKSYEAAKKSWLRKSMGPVKSCMNLVKALFGK